MSKMLYFAFIGAISIAAMAIYTYHFPASQYWQRTMFEVRERIRDWTRYHIYLRVYLLGYDGKVIPRSLRKLLARSEIHNAWLLGFMGFFEQDGIRFGPANPYPGNLAVAADP